MSKAMDHPLSCRRSLGRVRRCRGATLIEVLVSLTIGLIITAALAGLFVASNGARIEFERNADTIENGRYAVSVLQKELSQAGFYDLAVTPTGTANDVCSLSEADWRTSLGVYVMGWNNAEAHPDCLKLVENRKAGTDAIFIQRASSCAVSAANGAGLSGCPNETLNASNAYLQVSECSEEPLAAPFVLDKGNAGDTVFKLARKSCLVADRMPLRRLIRRVFYVNGQDQLSYVDVTLGGVSAPVVLAEGIEQLQFSYALDSNLDGSPDSFVATPTEADRPNLVGVKVWILARSASEGSKMADSAQSVFTMDDTIVTVDGATRQFRRRLYESYIAFVTPAVRRGA
jgi:type IV pilus assembly protein PilW